jgi:hypothetical protein
LLTSSEFSFGYHLDTMINLKTKPRSLHVDPHHSQPTEVLWTLINFDFTSFSNSRNGKFFASRTHVIRSYSVIIPNLQSKVS